MSRTLYTSVVAIVLLVVATPVRGQQSRPERPYRGLFGSTGSESMQILSVSGSAGGGYDSDLAADARSATTLSIPGGNARQSGTLGQFSGSLAYSLSTELASLSASAGSTGRYYPSRPGNHSILRREYAGVQASTQIAGVSVFGSANYSPFRLSDLYSTFFTPELGEPSADFDFGSSTEHFLSYSGGVDGGLQMSRRSRLGANYRYGSRTASVDVPTQESHMAGVGFLYNIGRGLDLNLGYRYTQASYAAQEPNVSHGINAGVDFRRALSFSRRTTLSFNTGTAAHDDPSTAEGLRYRAIGSAALTHEIGRTWTTSLSYSRALRLTDGWFGAVFSDAVTASVAGLVNRRLRVYSHGGTSTGHASGGSSNGGFDTYFADAGGTFALARFAAVGAGYRYHHHDFANGFSLPPGITPSQNRHSLHVYLSVWAPLYQRARRP